jgi:aspartyl-tRNA(Asn)/glutamyl-tRNA(Gln) amidotransferase subunit B
MTIIDTRTPDPKRFIPGATGDWEIVIGMEVHAQVISKSKLFSGASTEFGAEPNANVSLVDAAMPGMLPVINEECVRQAVRTGLGLKAQINNSIRSSTARTISTRTCRRATRSPSSSSRSSARARS